MDKQLLFEMLQFPITQVGDGNVIVFGDKTAIRQVPLRHTEYAVFDVATFQGARSWFLSAQELLLFSEDGSRELAFHTGRFGTPLGSVGFAQAIVEHTETNGTRIFALNTNQGCSLIELKNGEMRELTRSPLPFIACCSWTTDDKITFGGMNARSHLSVADDEKDEVIPGRPAILDLFDNNGERSVRLAPFDLAAIESQWRYLLPPQLQQPHIVSQLIPESIIAASRFRASKVFLIGILVLPNSYDELDRLAAFPAIEENLAVLVVEPEKLVLHTFKTVLSTLNTDSETYVYMSANQGHGGLVNSMTRLDLENPEDGDKPVIFNGVDSSLTCSFFQACFHPQIGYFGTVRLRAGKNDRSVSHFVQSNDGLSWNVVGRAGEVVIPKNLAIR